MINILSYVGITMQSEVCLWTLLGLLRTIFDATLFKVNANLKQVWHMDMPQELSMPVQRILRTMISGIMLVQCFTVYVYLASYIVLLYPVFLEERPTLVLPWLLLAAIRKLLCELLSLALGLGTCLLLGPGRPPCIKFVIIKIVSIMPAFYMWMLLLSYYHALKVASVFKSFQMTSPRTDMDYGLELAIRRRRTKSLFGEALVRNRLLSNVYAEKQMDAIKGTVTFHEHPTKSPAVRLSKTNSGDDIISKIKGNDRNVDSEKEIPTVDGYGNISEIFQSPLISNRTGSDVGNSEDWLGSEFIPPRNTDRINEQIGLMLLRISAYLKKNTSGNINLLESQSILQTLSESDHLNLNCPNLTTEATDTPPLVGSTGGNIASYLRDYPQIFMKKTSDLQLQQKLDSIRAVHSQIENIGTENVNADQQRVKPSSSKSHKKCKETEKHRSRKTKHEETQKDKKEEREKSDQNDNISPNASTSSKN